MRILISNDDGIDADGINILAQTLAYEHEVIIVAPMDNCSAYSHSITIYRELFYEKRQSKNGIAAYATSGTPADCVKFGIINLLRDNPPDLVISGINSGPNLGSDIMYSGTVAAASEGLYLGIRSIAVSIQSWDCTKEHYKLAAEFVKRNLDKLLSLNISHECVLNINYPVSADYKGAVFTRMGVNIYSDYFEKASLGEGYTLKGEPINHNKNEDDCDIEWIKKGYATITPLTIDRTDYRVLKLLKNGAELK